MNEIRIKRGASLNLSLWFEDEGEPLDLTNVGLACQVRSPDDTLVADLTVVKQVPLGQATAQVIDTSQWPVGRLRADLMLSIAGQVDFSETFPIMVTRQVTR